MGFSSTQEAVDELLSKKEPCLKVDGNGLDLLIENEPDFAYPIEFSSCDTPEKILKTIVELGDKSWVTAEHLVGLTLQASEHHGINFR